VAEYSSEDSAASSIAANDENHGEGSGGVRRSAGSFHVEALQMFLEGCALQKFNNACHRVLTHIH
jgi:hypothetical protein